MNNPKGAAIKAHDGGRRVLKLNTIMCDQRGVRLGVVGVPHKVQKWIDRIDRLIQKRPATVELPSPAPSTAVVVFLRTPPFDGRFH